MPRTRKLSRPVDARTYEAFRRVWSQPAPVLIESPDGERRSRELCEARLRERGKAQAVLDFTI